MDPAGGGAGDAERAAVAEVVGEVGDRGPGVPHNFIVGIGGRGRGDGGRAVMDRRCRVGRGIPAGEISGFRKEAIASTPPVLQSVARTAILFGGDDRPARG